MANYCEEEEVYETFGVEKVDGLEEGELLEIEKEYSRRRLVESLVGPVISTGFHVLLIILMAIFIIDTVKNPEAELEITVKSEVPIDIPKIPEIVEPKPELKTPDTFTKELTMVKLEDNTENNLALENTDNKTPSTDNDAQKEAVADTLVTLSAIASPTLAGGSRISGKAAAVTSGGGSEIAQCNLRLSLMWLAKVQNPDGSWGKGKGVQTAMTSLSLLTFLAHGELPTSKNYGTNVRNAMKWLVKDPIDIKSSHGYPHALKTYALADAYAMTGISLLEKSLNSCVKVLIKGQQAGGSYNYNYNTDEKRQDLSFAGWNFQALKAAEGAGCDEPGLQEAIYKAIDWLKKNTAGSNKFAYSNNNNVPKTGRAKHTMRAAGVLCLQLFGEGDCPEIADDLATIAETDLANFNWQKPPAASLYGWYYATNVMFQAGGDFWVPWRKKFEKELSENQHKEGFWEYPGKGHAPKDELSSRIYSTTLCALMLTVYYRTLPSAKRVNRSSVKLVKKALKVPELEEGLELVD